MSGEEEKEGWISSMISAIAGMFGSKKKKRTKADGGDPNAVSLPRAMQDMADRRRQLEQVK